MAELIVNFTITGATVEQVFVRQKNYYNRRPMKNNEKPNNFLALKINNISEQLVKMLQKFVALLVNNSKIRLVSKFKLRSEQFRKNGSI